MGDAAMPCAGTAGDVGVVLLGSYGGGGGPDWGWRIVIVPDGDDLRLVMTNITPEGQEAPAVEARYARVPDAA
jgi:hypothetical protein